MKRVSRIATPFSDLVLMFVTAMPGATGIHLRRRYWRRRLRHLGNDVRIDPGVYFQNPQYISICDSTWIDRGVMILAGPDASVREVTKIANSAFRGEPGTVSIGKRVHIAPHCIISGISGGVEIADDCGFSAGCRVYAFSHRHRSPRRPGDRSVSFGPLVEPSRQSMISGAVVLGYNTGVALNAVLLPGVCIGEDSFVAIGSVVGKGVYPANSMIAGNPAKRTGTRFVVAAVPGDAANAS